jgi:hypothetical protein
VVDATLLADRGGESYGPEELVGATWTQTVPGKGPEQFVFRIVAAERDLSYNMMSPDSMSPASGVGINDNSEIWLFDIVFWNDELFNPTSGQYGRWDNVCEGGGKGFFMNGTWDATGTFSETGITFACERGVASKCARSWGYKPWVTVEHVDGYDVQLDALHRTCVRAAMADYCGDGVSYTRDDTIVDLIDAYGFNVPATQAELQALASEYAPGAAIPYIVETESYFSPRGAAAVHHYRWPGQLELVDGVLTPVEEACEFDVFTTGMWNWSQYLGAPMISVASHEIDWPGYP